MDFEQARMNMVECQVKPRNIRDQSLCEVLSQVPREIYVPENMRVVAYMDKWIPLQDTGRFLMDVASFARLVTLVNIEENDLVLDIACGLGYSTAVLAQLAGAVIGLESDAVLAKQARATFNEHVIDNAMIIEGNHSEGYVKQGLYDVIFINGFVLEVSNVLLQQLEEKGRLVCATLDKASSRAVVFTRKGEAFTQHIAFDILLPTVPDFISKDYFVF